MIASLRAAVRPAVRSATATKRSYSSAGDAVGEAFIKQREATKHHAAGSSNMWRKVTFYIALPGCVLGYLNAENLAKEHHKHLEHVKEENGGELPERIEYDYMNKRAKSFPWGNKTLFYNPHTNLPPPE